MEDLSMTVYDPLEHNSNLQHGLPEEYGILHL